MELAVLPARVDVRRQVGEQPFVVLATCKGAIEQARIDANDDRAEPIGEEPVRELICVAAPEWKPAAFADGRQPALPIGADVLEEKVAERDLLDVSQRGRGKRGHHPRLVDVVAAPGWNLDLDQGNPDRTRSTA